MRKREHVDPEVVKKYGITSASKSEDYADILLPLDRHDWIGKEWLSFHQIARWTNLKAELAGDGPDGMCHNDFKCFTHNEIREHLELYVLQCFNPSPHVEWKLQR